MMQGGCVNALQETSLTFLITWHSMGRDHKNVNIPQIKYATRIFNGKKLPLKFTQQGLPCMGLTPYPFSQTPLLVLSSMLFLLFSSSGHGSFVSHTIKNIFLKKRKKVLAAQLPEHSSDLNMKKFPSPLRCSISFVFHPLKMVHSS